VEDRAKHVPFVEEEDSHYRSCHRTDEQECIRRIATLGYDRICDRERAIDRPIPVSDDELGKAGRKRAHLEHSEKPVARGERPKKSRHRKGAKPEEHDLTGNKRRVGTKDPREESRCDDDGAKPHDHEEREKTSADDQMKPKAGARNARSKEGAEQGAEKRRRSAGGDGQGPADHERAERVDEKSKDFRQTRLLGH
jgi:hypothetical protein